MKEKIIIAVSGSSGAGKTTLIKHAENLLRAHGISVAATLSSTNRRPRKKEDHTFERDGIDYRFYTPEEFRQLKDKGEFFITSSVHGNEYGTLNRDIVDRSEDVFLMNIDFGGAIELRKRYPDNTALVFIAADVATVQKRLEERETASSDDIKRRKADMYKQLQAAIHYDYIIYNNGALMCAVDELCAVIRAQLNRRSLPHNMAKLKVITEEAEVINK